jgi:hypothetical protein
MKTLLPPFASMRFAFVSCILSIAALLISGDVNAASFAQGD